MQSKKQKSELLLNVVVEYEVKRTAEYVDWEWCIFEYSDILLDACLGALDGNRKRKKPDNLRHFFSYPLW